MAVELEQAIIDREDRAIEVRDTYLIEFVGCQAWVVQHPIEPERCYLVDFIERTCTCPDYNCYCQAHGRGIDCKHLLALLPRWEETTGVRLPFRLNGRAVADPGFVAIRDADRDEFGNLVDPFAID